MKANDIKDDGFDIARLILLRHIKENRMRNTPERTEILKMLYSANNGFTPDEVCKAMEKSFRVSRSTAYNTLKLFYSLGLVTRQQEGKVVRFEACINERDCFKTVCTRCGKTQRFEAKLLTNAFSSVKYKRFQVEQIVAYVYGICSSCQAKATKNRKKIETKENKK